MHRRASILVCGTLLIASAGLAAAQDANDFKTDLDKISYVIGTNVAGTIKRTGSEVNLDVLARGLRESIAGKPSPFTQQQAAQLMDLWQKKAAVDGASRSEIPDVNDLKTDLDKMSYVIGANVATTIKNTGCQVSTDMLVRGLREALAGRPSPFTRQQETKLMAIWQRMQKEAKLGENAWKVKLTKPEMMKFDANKDYFWVLETNKGDIKIKLMPQIAPMHCTNAIFLTNKGYYDGLTFHRVIDNFMAQGGCPFGDGSGDPGYSISGEFDRNVKHSRAYLLSTANSGPDTDGSQFFITFAPAPHLDGKHTIFGEVVEGQDAVKKLNAAAGPAPDGKPKEPLIIKKARIEEKAKG